jgi:hypothetical protein
MDIGSRRYQGVDGSMKRTDAPVKFRRLEQLELPVAGGARE